MPKIDQTFMFPLNFDNFYVKKTLKISLEYCLEEIFFKYIHVFSKYRNIAMCFEWISTHIFEFIIQNIVILWYYLGEVATSIEKLT